MSSHRKSRAVRRSEKRRRVAPPLRNGINAAPLRLPEGPWETLREWFVQRFGEHGADLFASGAVLAGHGVPLDGSEPYRPGERIWVFRPVLDEPSEPIVLPVVAENERYVIVDKPHGMASVPKGSHVAQSALVTARRQFHNDLLVAAHRLDLETAGLLLLIKEPRWRGDYQLLFERRKIRKKYHAVAPIIDVAQAEGAAYSCGAVPPIASWHSVLTLYKTEGNLQVQVLASELPQAAPHVVSDEAYCSERHVPGEYYGERRTPLRRTQSCAVTDIELVRDLGNGLGRYDLYPHTGFTHQLRVAMSALGAPICGDPIYPQLLSRTESAARLFPLQLLAAELEFIDPVTQEQVHVVSARRLALER